MEDTIHLQLAPGVALELVRIPEGEFWMGAQIWGELEGPKHRVFLPEYFMGEYPVTVGQYAAYVGATSVTTRPGQIDHLRADLPVVQVTWYDALAFCRWVNDLVLLKIESFKGWQARLPGEAEWEKAARGTDAGEYPWGGREPDASRCNYNRNLGELTPVGAFSPQGDSPYGCADMAGNVWEWTHSLLKTYPYDAEDGRENEAENGERVVRGGAVYSYAAFMRCSYRGKNKPEQSLTSRGFRLCVSPVQF